jgi:hypothetical protein
VNANLFIFILRKIEQLGQTISPTPANEHTKKYISHQIIEQKKTMIYIDGNPGRGQAQTIWRS